jgi:ABC-type maltose transport system permease subunit
MSAPALEPVRTPVGTVSADPTKRTGKQDRTTPARFDTALGWNDGPGLAWTLRILLCALTLAIFAAPFLTIISGAFDRNASGSSLSFYTVTVALSVLRTDPEVASGVLLAGAVLALIPTLVVYLLLQRSLVSGIAAGATKG